MELLDLGGTQAAVPYVGGLSAGMASYRAVVWQTGFEQYPMFTDAARDSIARLDLLGSRLAVFSQDAAWDLSDATSLTTRPRARPGSRTNLKRPGRSIPPRSLW